MISLYRIKPVTAIVLHGTWLSFFSFLELVNCRKKLKLGRVYGMEMNDHVTCSQGNSDLIL